MTKAELIDQVYLYISSGKLSQDITVRRPDIRNMLSAAMQYAVLVYSREERRDTLSDIRLMGPVGGATGKWSQEILSTIEAVPEEDAARGLHYVNIPGRIMRMPGSYGLDDVLTKCNTPYQKVGGPKELFGLPLFDTVYYWFERVNNTEKVYFKNIGMPVGTHYIRVILNVDDLQDTDEVPLPNEFDAIRLMAEYFLGVRQMPVDIVNDDKENSQ